MTEAQKQTARGGVVIGLAAIASATFLGWQGVISGDAVVGVIFGVAGIAGGTAATVIRRNE